MFKLRKSCFETNSSSTHSIIIFKDKSQLEDFYDGKLAFRISTGKLMPFEEVEKKFYKDYNIKKGSLSQEELDSEIYSFIYQAYLMCRQDAWGKYYRVGDDDAIKELEDGRIIVSVYASGN